MNIIMHKTHKIYQKQDFIKMYSTRNPSSNGVPAEYYDTNSHYLTFKSLMVCSFCADLIFIK